MIARFLRHHEVEQLWDFRNEHGQEVALRVRTKSDGDKWDYVVWSTFPIAASSSYVEPQPLGKSDYVHLTAQDATRAALDATYEWRLLALEKLHLERKMAEVTQ